MPDRLKSTYGAFEAATFLLNMQLGSGVLLLPLAFAEAGLALSSLFLLIVCSAAFVSASWIVEAMAIANHKYKTSAEYEMEAIDNEVRLKQTTTTSIADFV